MKSRKVVRKLVINHRIFDRYLGKALVNLDLSIRKTGVLDCGLQKGWINHNGFKIYFGKEDVGLASFLVTNSDYETETREVIEGILKSGDVFVDLGANIGFFTLIAARIVGEKGRVYAFEPTPGTRDILVKNVQENGFCSRVTIEKDAISESSGKARFCVNALSEYNSICEDGAEENLIEVNTISLDEYFLKDRFDKIDLIKMDIEGQEMAALRGMERLNNENENLKIIFEYHKEVMNNCNVSGSDIFTLLQGYGFNRFTGLFREPFQITLPDGLKNVDRVARRTNLNILAEKQAT